MNREPQLSRPHKNFERALRIVLALIAAHYIVVNGTDYNFLKLLINRNYYIEMGFSVLVAILLVTWVSYISLRLDKRLGWQKQSLLERSLLQCLYGLVLPGLFEFVLIICYFWFGAHINVLKTGFMNTEFRLVIVLILFFNLYCIARYFYYRQRQTEKELEAIHQMRNDPQQQRMLEKSLKPNAINEMEAVRLQNEQESSQREIFIVNTPLRSIPIRIEEICSFYRANGYYYLRTYDQNINDAYIIPQTLKEVEEIIHPNHFFRINRRMIISFKSCISFRPGKGKMLELIVSPKHVDEEGKELLFVTVSEDRVHAFRAWMDR